MQLYHMQFSRFCFWFWISHLKIGRLLPGGSFLSYLRILILIEHCHGGLFVIVLIDVLSGRKLEFYFRICMNIFHRWSSWILSDSFFWVWSTMGLQVLLIVSEAQIFNDHWFIGQLLFKATFNLHLKSFFESKSISIQ